MKFNDNGLVNTEDAVEPKEDQRYIDSTGRELSVSKVVKEASDGRQVIGSVLYKGVHRAYSTDLPTFGKVWQPKEG